MAEPRRSWLAELREADRAFARVAPSDALDARVRASLEARAERSPVMRRGLVLAVSLGLLFVGLRAIEQRSVGIARVNDAADASPATTPSDDPTIPSASPVERRRSADDGAPRDQRAPRRAPVPESEAPDARSRPSLDAPPSSPPRDVDDRFDPRVPWRDAPRFELVPGPTQGRDGVLHFSRSSPDAPFVFGPPQPGALSLRVGSLRGGSASDGSPPVAPETTPPPLEEPHDDPELACETEVIAPAGCVDIAELKLQASEALCADGLYLSAFDVDMGTCGEGLAAAAKYTCCPPTAAPPPEEKPSGPGEGANCKPLSIVLDACAPTSALDVEAEKQCGEGALVVDHKYLGDCADGAASEGWFTCCPVAMDVQDG